MSRARKQAVSWFLVKSETDLNDLQSIIEPPEAGALTAFRVSALDSKQDTLYVKSSPPRPPKWLSYVRGHVDAALPSILGASSAAVLFVRAAGRVLALTFGYGRFLLKPEMLVQDFGLRVVLNSVDPAHIKSIDARSFDELTVHTRRGVSRDSPLNAFELDVSRNLLRGITGRSSVEGLQGGLTGAAALKMNTTTQVPDLPGLAECLVAAFESTTYREAGFGFVDHMRAERDPSTVATLDAQLVQALIDKDMTTMHLAIPEAVDWQGIAGVRFSFKKKDHEPMSDPKISVYRSLRDDPENLTLARLRSDRVEAISAEDEDQLRGRWRVYDCIVFETEHEGFLYVLSGGDWYRISKSYRDRVEEEIRALPELDVGLPSATAGEDEPAYNTAAAASIGALNLDEKLIAVGGPDRIEVCDLLTLDGTFIHVKKRGRSSTLSHLFAQGIASAELLLNDDEFRSAATELVRALDNSFVSAIPADSGGRESIKVAYVVLSRGQRPDRPFGLPFFSLVSLQAAARRLHNAGIAVFAQEIHEVDAD